MTRGVFMYSDTLPAPLDGDGGVDRWAEFRVDHPQERRALLRQLRDSSVPVNLSAPRGNALTTALWAVDDESLVFDAGASMPQVEALLEADEVVAVAYLESVKLQFDLHDLVLVRGARGATLKAAVPSDIYRFQRRHSYRVRTNERSAPVARLRHPAIAEMRLALRVMDVSVGGCALWLPDNVPPLVAGVALNDVEVTLDSDTRFVATMEVQHVSAMAPGRPGMRLGCEWILVPAAERSLQRYIDQAQKRRRMLSLD